MTAAACLALLDSLGFDALHELALFTADARGDAEYLAKVDEWRKKRVRVERRRAKQVSSFGTPFRDTLRHGKDNPQFDGSDQIRARRKGRAHHQDR